MTIKPLLIAAQLLFILVVMAPCAQAGQPARFSYQARLTDSSGVALTGNQNLTFQIYRGGSAGALDSGTLIYAETITRPVVDGVLNHPVGMGSPTFGGPLSPDHFRTSENLFLQVTVGAGNVILPRTRLEPVPFAITALSAENGEARFAIRQPDTFPIVLDQPGSYYLAENITGSAAAGGISITTSGVTLDLNGFQLARAPGTPGSGAGVTIAGTAANTAVRNGTIRGWGSGLIAQAPKIYGITLHRLRITDNGDFGADAASNSHISDCLFERNGGVGLLTGSGCLIATSVSNENTYGIITSVECAITNCVANANIIAGILAQSGTVTSCVSNDNGVAGMISFGKIRIHSCTANDNVSTGIALSGGQRGSHIEGCVVSGNGGDGILVSHGCLILNNQCSDNWVPISGFGTAALAGADEHLGAGISVAGTQNRIDGNTLTGNRIGLACRTTGNLIVRNAAAGNSLNFIVGAGNSVAAIEALPGNNFLSQQPWANFIY